MDWSQAKEVTPETMDWTQATLVEDIVPTVSNNVAPPAPVPGTGSLYSEPDMWDQTVDFTKDLGSMVLPEEGRQAVKSGAGKILGGVAMISEDIANLFRTTDSNVIETWSRDNKAEIDQYNEEHPDAPINPSTIGDISASIVGGMAAVTPKAIALVDGLIGTLRSVGEGNDYKSAISTGIYEGGLAGLSTAAINRIMSGNIAKDKATDAYDHLVDHYNLDTAKVNADFKNWQKLKNEPDTPQNRVKALVDNLGSRGAEVRFKASESSEAVKNMNKSTQETKQELVDLAKGDFKVETFAEDLQNSFTRVGKEYESVRSLLSDKQVKVNIQTEPWEALDEATTGAVKELKQLIGEDVPIINVKDLVDAVPVVNSIIARSKGRTLRKWTEVKNSINSEIKANTSIYEYNLWNKANQNYSKMKTVQTSALGNLIMSSIGKTIKGTPKLAPEAVMRKIKTVAGGDDIFNNIVGLVGTDKTALLEKGIIKRTLEGKLGEASWETISKNLENNGFVTTEGKELKNLINIVRDTFKTDDAVRSLNVNAGSEGASIATTIQGKLQVSLIQKLFTMFKKHKPFDKTAKHLLTMDEVYKILESPTQSKRLANQISGLSDEQIGRISNDLPSGVATIQNEIKGELSSKIDDLQKHSVQGTQMVKTTDYLQSPTNYEEANNVLKEYYGIKETEPLGTQSYKISDLVNTQEYVSTKGLKEKVFDVDNELPTVINFNGANYLVDGHHRVVLDSIKGVDTINAKYYEAN